MKKITLISIAMLLSLYCSAQSRPTFQKSNGPGQINKNVSTQPIQKTTNTSLPAKGKLTLRSNGFIKMKLRLPFAAKEMEYMVRKVGHYYILNDDIIVGNDFPKTRSYSIDNGIFTNYKWDNAEIPVVIDKSIFENNMQNMVVGALNEMNTQLELRIVARTTQEDYVRIEFSSTILGSGESPVGRQGGEQPLFLAKSATKATVWHELLHAAGIWHEQSRDDRDKFIQINEANLTDGAEHNFQYESGNNQGDYDFCSIMHYSANAFSKNGQPTIECKSNNTTAPCPTCMGQRTGFSAQDIKGLDQFYNEVSRFASHYKFILPQASWRFCNKCSGMFFDGYMDKGSCPEKGQHQAAGYNFQLPHDIAGTATSQTSWRYCSKCYLLFYSGYTNKGTCNQGGAHIAAGYNFVLPHDVAGKPSTQSSWRYCNKCYVMFYDGYAKKGLCAAGGAHTSAGYNFVLSYN
ncbi:MAG: M12 family metallopeptidase [Chitinophagaceae bacterium]|nr:M12 family metallopeptidase [Chitinophagaceae bacterium]